MNNHSISEIDLNDYRNSGTRVFSGKDYGRQIRQKSKIELIEKNATMVHIIVPEDVYSINPSFLEEFL